MKNLKTVELSDLVEINGGGILCPYLTPYPNPTLIIHYPYPERIPSGTVLSSSYTRKGVSSYLNS